MATTEPSALAKDFISDVKRLAIHHSFVRVSITEHSTWYVVTLTSQKYTATSEAVINVTFDGARSTRVKTTSRLLWLDGGIRPASLMADTARAQAHVLDFIDELSRC